MRNIIYIFLITLNILFADTQKINMPQTPNIQMPKNPTMPQIETPKMPSQDNNKESTLKDNILHNIIDDAVRQNMLLISSCIPETMELKSKLSLKEVKQMGVKLQLTTTQYKDNLLRLKPLKLNMANANTQNKFIPQEKEQPRGILIVISFLHNGMEKHTISISPNYLQIDNELLENTQQIFRIFQIYFCNASTIKEYQNNM